MAVLTTVLSTQMPEELLAYRDEEFFGCASTEQEPFTDSDDNEEELGVHTDSDDDDITTHLSTTFTALQDSD